MNPILFILLPAAVLSFIAGAISTASKHNRLRRIRPYRRRAPYQ